MKRQKCAGTRRAQRPCGPCHTPRHYGNQLAHPLASWDVQPLACEMIGECRPSIGMLRALGDQLVDPSEGA